jgi:hypothetical protein
MLANQGTTVFANRVVMRILGPNGTESSRRGENTAMRNSIICVHSPSIIRIMKSMRMK